MMRSLRHSTEASRRIAGVEPAVTSFAQVGDHVLTVDGPGVVSAVYEAPFGAVSFEIVLDDGLGGGEYDDGMVLAVLYDEFTRSARRYSQVPMACDDCGCPAESSTAGGPDGHRMLCDSCRDKRGKAPRKAAQVPVQGGSQGEGTTRSAARGPLPLMTPEEAREQGLKVASDDDSGSWGATPVLRSPLGSTIGHVLSMGSDAQVVGVDTPSVVAGVHDLHVARVVHEDHVGQPMGGDQPRSTGQQVGSIPSLAVSATVSGTSPLPTPTPHFVGDQDGSHEADAQGSMWRGHADDHRRFGARAPMPLLSAEELQQAGLRTAADDYEQLGEILWTRPDWIEAEPIVGMPRRVTLGSKAAAAPKREWMKQKPPTNPIKDSLTDPNQPFWWRKIVGPMVDRFNDELPDGRRTDTMDDLFKMPGPSWCRFRYRGECYFPAEKDEQGSAEAGYVVWKPLNRGLCPWRTYDAQKNHCRVSEPGPDSGEQVFYSDATVSWQDGGQRTSSLATPVQITSKRTATWADVRDKAKRIRQSGGVRIIAADDSSVTGEVRGDTGLYTATITLVPGSRQVGIATCSCPWETYRWTRSGPWKKYEGRACAHITALLFEIQSRKMFGGEITEDVATPEWRTEQPALEPERQQPGPWRLDRAAALARHLGTISALRVSLDARAALDVRLDPQVASLALAVASLEAVAGGVAAGVESEGLISLAGTDEVAMPTPPAATNYVNETLMPKMEQDLADASLPGYYLTDQKTAAIEGISEGEQAVIDACAEGEFEFSGLVIKAADSGRVLMTQRTPYHGDDEETYGSWEFPGGHIEEGETPLDGALREFAEETGLDLPEGWRIDGCDARGKYLAIHISVPHETWTTHVELLPMETMGIGWFDPEHVEESPLTRPEVDDTDWDLVREASGRLRPRHADVAQGGEVVPVVAVPAVAVRPAGGLDLGLPHLAGVEGAVAVQGGGEVHARHSATGGTHVDAARSLVAQRNSLDYDDYEKRAVALYKSLGLPEIPASTPTGYWAGPLFTIRNISTRTSNGRDRVAYRVETADGQAVSTCFNFPEARRSYAVAVIESLAEAKIEPYEDEDGYHDEDGGLHVGAVDEVEAILHDEPEPALPEAYGGMLGDGIGDPDRFSGAPVKPSTTDSRMGPDEPWTLDSPEDNPGSESFQPGDPRLAWLMEGSGAPADGDGDVAAAAQAFLAKTALKDFSAAEQQALITEGEAEGRGARNTDMLVLDGTHYAEMEEESDPNTEQMWW